MNPDTDIISWNGLLPLSIFNKKYLDRAVFFCHFNFFNSYLEKINEINFLRYQLQNYFYESALNINDYFQTNHIRLIENNIHHRYGYFVRLKGNNYLCLHRTQWSYFLYGQIENDCFITLRKININNISKMDKYLNFLKDTNKALKLLNKI